MNKTTRPDRIVVRDTPGALFSLAAAWRAAGTFENTDEPRPAEGARQPRVAHLRPTSGSAGR